jgi:hypothetical protein
MEIADEKTPIIAPPKRAKRTGVVRIGRRVNFIQSTPFAELVSKLGWPRNEYEYKPLAEDEIRLLLLQPGEPDAMIECALVISNLQDAVYEALSYAWGTEAPMHQIRILGFEGHRSLRNFRRARCYIRPNLYSALRTLRDPKRLVILWVDALCINQADNQEKSAQVSKLPEIYSRASNVCVWLGEGSLTRTIALRFIPEILDLPRFDTLIRDEFTTNQWIALIHLMRSQWFCQIWAIQNILFAREASLHC